MTKPSAIPLLFTVSFSFMLSSCITLDSTLDLVGLGSENNLGKISIESAVDSNSNAPVAMDFVFIFDESVANLLANITTAQWFENKSVLTQKYASNLTVISREVVPATFITSVKLPDKSKNAMAVLFFTNYLKQQEQSASRLEEYQQVNIKLNREQYIIKADRS